MADAMKVPTTSPDSIADVGSLHEAFAATAAVASGVASKYWLELVAYPPGSARSLWLYVSGSWRRLDGPSAAIQQSVQDAFANAATFEVTVWYNGQLSVGLVATTKGPVDCVRDVRPCRRSRRDVKHAPTLSSGQRHSRKGELLCFTELPRRSCSASHALVVFFLRASQTRPLWLPG